MKIPQRSSGKVHGNWVLTHEEQTFIKCNGAGIVTHYQGVIQDIAARKNSGEVDTKFLTNTFRDYIERV
jgi:hypothetical protein